MVHKKILSSREIRRESYQRKPYDKKSIIEKIRKRRPSKILQTESLSYMLLDEFEAFVELESDAIEKLNYDELERQYDIYYFYHS